MWLTRARRTYAVTNPPGSLNRPTKRSWPRRREHGHREPRLIPPLGRPGVVPVSVPPPSPNEVESDGLPLVLAAVPRRCTTSVGPGLCPGRGAAARNDRPPYRSEPGRPAGAAGRRRRNSSAGCRSTSPTALLTRPRYANSSRTIPRTSDKHWSRSCSPARSTPASLRLSRHHADGGAATSTSAMRSGRRGCTKPAWRIGRGTRSSVNC